MGIAPPIQWYLVSTSPTDRKTSDHGQIGACTCTCTTVVFNVSIIFFLLSTTLPCGRVPDGRKSKWRPLEVARAQRYLDFGGNIPPLTRWQQQWGSNSWRGRFLTSWNTLVGCLLAVWQWTKAGVGNKPGAQRQGSASGAETSRSGQVSQSPACKFVLRFMPRHIITWVCSGLVWFTITTTILL